MVSLRSLKSNIYEREERKLQYQSHIRGLNAYERHKKFVKDYVEFYGKDKRTDVKLSIKTDQDTLREGYRFIPSEEDDLDSSWEKRLVKKYYDKLFKEYCIADMSQYKKGKIGLRWRLEKEVISGKGQFICGNRECNEKDGLGSYEVNFSYFEAGENKQALVKLVACKRCAEKLVYKRRKDEEARMEEERKLEEKELMKEWKKDKHKWARVSDKVDNEPSDECDRISRHKGSSMSGDKPSDRYHRSSRKKGSRKADDESSDEYDRSSRKKGRKSSSSHGEAKDDEDFDDFLVGMFP